MFTSYRLILKPKWRQEHHVTTNRTSDCAGEDDATSRSGTYDEITVDASDENSPVCLFNANSTSMNYLQLDCNFVENKAFKEADEVLHEQVYLTPLFLSAVDSI